MWGEDLLSSSIALCRHKQEKKETWSRQMNYYNIRLTYSDGNICLLKSGCWNPHRYAHLWTTATLLLIFFLQPVCYLSVSGSFNSASSLKSNPFFSTLVLVIRNTVNHLPVNIHQHTQCLKPSMAPFNNLFTPHILYSDWWRLLWKFFCLAALTRGNGHNDIRCDVCYRVTTGQGWL